jgi:hypothetical protein
LIYGISFEFESVVNFIVHMITGSVHK